MKARSLYLFVFLLIGGLFYYFSRESSLEPVPGQLPPKTTVSDESSGASNDSLGLVEEELSSEPELTEAWAQWIETYGSSSPLKVLRKTRPTRLQISDEQIQSVLQGQTNIQLKEPLQSQDGLYKSIDLSRFDESRRFEVHRQYELQVLNPKMSTKDLITESSRFRDVRDHMQELIIQRKPKDLLLLYVGQTHALDLYFGSFLKPDMLKTDPLYRIRQDVIYLSGIVTERTPFFTESYYDLLRALRGSEIASVYLKDNELFDFANFLGRLSYYNQLKAGLISLESLKTELKPHFGAFVFMDIHNLGMPKVFEQLPNARELVRLGVQNVKLAMEGWQYDKSYSSEELQRFYRATTKSYLSGEDLEYFQQFRKEVVRLLDQGLIYNKTIQALHEKLQSYERAGIRVEYTGLEKNERI